MLNLLSSVALYNNKNTIDRSSIEKLSFAVETGPPPPHARTNAHAHHPIRDRPIPTTHTRANAHTNTTLSETGRPHHTRVRAHGRAHTRTCTHHPHQRPARIHPLPISLSTCPSPPSPPAFVSSILLITAAPPHICPPPAPPRTVFLPSDSPGPRAPVSWAVRRGRPATAGGASAARPVSVRAGTAAGTGGQRHTARSRLRRLGRERRGKVRPVAGGRRRDLVVVVVVVVVCVCWGGRLEGMVDEETRRGEGR